MDARLAEMEAKLVSNWLEHNLGSYNFGRHAEAAANSNFERSITDGMKKHKQI
jgi:hypothetical protein